MIKFDRIKLQTKAKYIYELKPDLVKTSIDNKTGIKSFVIKQRTPFNLFIQTNPSKDEAIIEFSGKILLDDYPKLISSDTIHQCLENISKMGFCKLDVNNTINDSNVLSCDITRDIDGIYLPNDFKPMLMAFLRHVSKYHIQKYLASGYTITKEVNTPDLKVRLSIYNKSKELSKATNRNFLNLLESPDELLDYFSDKYRIETNLRTFEQIRNYCETANNSLANILDSKANPLLKIFDIVFTEDMKESDNPENTVSSIFDYTNIDQLRIALVMEACNNDLEKVLALLKCNYSPKSNFRKIIAPYKTFIKSAPNQSQNRLMIGKIRDKLSA